MSITIVNVCSYSQFQVNGFRQCRSDRKAGGGGLMIYVRRDIRFVKVKHLKGITPEERAATRTETLILKVKLSRSWIVVAAVFYAGDFNADLLNPDKPPKDGRNLLDFMEIFGLDWLITKNIRHTSRFNFDQQQEKDIGI